ncbi:MAG: aryl-sulfate sulfotransferase, partial [Planctomycetes bacterium]|nr:aryl-sulfate sulfotransferase [Planctomycetota bacterium]
GGTENKFFSSHISGADRLPNGNVLIADGEGSRVIEVTRDGEVVWEMDRVESAHDADRLPNGNTLITQRTKHQVIEVDRSGKIVFQITDLSSPSDADRLPNGHTLVAENGGVREFDRNGNQVAEIPAAWAVEVNRY